MPDAVELDRGPARRRPQAAAVVPPPIRTRAVTPVASIIWEATVRCQTSS